MRMPFLSGVLSSQLAVMALLAGLGPWSAFAGATQASQGFNVTVTLQPSTDTPLATSQPQSAFCKTSNDAGAPGATYTVVCATGVLLDITSERAVQAQSPAHGSAYRYVLQANHSNSQLGLMNSYAGAGTSASWRRVDINELDYLELLIYW